MIENTNRRDPYVHFLGGMSDGPERYITDIEAAGQRQLVHGSEIPKSGPWDQLEALGFVRGADVDDLFVTAELPAGWSKQAYHSMGSIIVDDRGIERVSIFYKAAFYDRKASFHIVAVGPKLAQNVTWGDDPVTLPSCWDQLTDSEKTDYAAAIENALAAELDRRGRVPDGEALRQSQKRIDRIATAQTLLAQAGMRPTGGIR
ncbi:hypothetical protein NONO_c59980 [Nocardia nova SH22a]|uniref:Uncharacterized protein n=1 Tax=Nocardia nova SH22a TaxID=1415166 RepID=W5TNN4_9NOCA|nr:hypothetical protein [Nocardia nova]AHH20774.1 hypothetical protein NONO_c59980 [Nocardia nova SH22a]